MQGVFLLTDFGQVAGPFGAAIVIQLELTLLVLLSRSSRDG